MSRKAANKATKKDQRSQLQANAAAYPRDAFIEIPWQQWARLDSDPTRFKVMASREFLVQLFNEPKDIIRISITKNRIGFRQGSSFADGISWIDTARNS